MLTFIIGSSGSATGFGMIASLRGQWKKDVRIIALDTNRSELNAASMLADAYIQVPPVADPVYGGILMKALASVEPPAVYMPIHDAEILDAAERWETGCFPAGVTLAAAGNAQAVRSCNDKLETYAVLSGAGVLTPRTAPLSDGFAFASGTVLKPRRGVGSVVAITRSAEEFASVSTNCRSTDFVVQELCNPPEVTVDVFVGRPGGPNAGRMEVLCRERLQVKAGVATKCRIYTDPELARLAADIAITLNFIGAFCFQVMHSRESVYCVTDLNPRPGGGTRMSAAAGCDFMAASAADAVGMAVDTCFKPVDMPCYVIRQHREYLTGFGVHSGA